MNASKPIPHAPLLRIGVRGLSMLTRGLAPALVALLGFGIGAVAKPEPDAARRGGAAPIAKAPADSPYECCAKADIGALRVKKAKIAAQLPKHPGRDWSAGNPLRPQSIHLSCRTQSPREILSLAPAGPRAPPAA